MLSHRKSDVIHECEMSDPIDSWPLPTIPDPIPDDNTDDYPDWPE